MKKNRITTGFYLSTDAAFETKAESIYAAMLGNSNFPAPIPAITVVDAAVQAYQSALTAAQFRDKNSVAIKNQAREDLTVILTQLADSVMTTANGDRTMLISSGFDINKSPEPTPIIKPDTIVLADGLNAGELTLKVPAVPGARGYVHEYTLDPLTPESQWTRVMTTVSKYTFKNLKSAQKYWCRVAVVGPFDQLVYSDAVSRVVQ
jgi:hypothetical protein